MRWAFRSQIISAWVDQGGGTRCDPLRAGLGSASTTRRDRQPAHRTSSIPPFCADPTGGHWSEGSGGWWYACADGSAYLANGWFTINSLRPRLRPDGYT